MKDALGHVCCTHWSLFHRTVARRNAIATLNVTKKDQRRSNALCARLLPRRLTRLTSSSEINYGKKSGCVPNATRPYQNTQPERRSQAKPKDIFWTLVEIFVPCVQSSLQNLNKSTELFSIARYQFMSNSNQNSRFSESSMRKRKRLAPIRITLPRYFGLSSIPRP